jgi:hypothetical protein
MLTQVASQKPRKGKTQPTSQAINEIVASSQANAIKAKPYGLLRKP